MPLILHAMICDNTRESLSAREVNWSPGVQDYCCKSVTEASTTPAIKLKPYNMVHSLRHTEKHSYQAGYSKDSEVTSQELAKGQSYKDRLSLEYIVSK